MPVIHEQELLAAARAALAALPAVLKRAKRTKRTTKQYVADIAAGEEALLALATALRGRAKVLVLKKSD